jgi:hypothetical protein
MSIAGGYYKAVEAAARVGCDCVQLFTAAPQQWPVQASKTTFQSGRLLTYNTAASTSQQMVFFHHADARPRSEKKKITCYPSTFIGRKVTVDPLGRVRWAND